MTKSLEELRAAAYAAAEDHAHDMKHDANYRKEVKRIEQRRASRPYYVLLINVDNVWGIEFGDHDKQCVEFERDEAYSHIRTKFKKIIRCNDARNSSVERAVAEFKSKEV